MPPPRHGRRRRFLLRLLGDHRFGRDQQAGDGRGVLERGSHDLGRVDDAGLEQVAIFARLRVVAERIVLLPSSLPTTIEPSTPAFSTICRAGCCDRPADDVDAGPLVVVVELDLRAPWPPQQRHAAAGDDAFLDRGAGCVQRVLDAVLLLLHFDLGCAADADHRDAARELGQALLQLLLVVVRGGLLDLRLDLLDAALDVASSCRRRR